MHLRWIEPKSATVGRARLRNQPRIFVPVALVLIAASAALPALTFPLLMRLSTGSWHLPASLLFGAVIGTFLGVFVAVSSRFPTKRQKIELREDGFTIRGTAKFSLQYHQLRGYSLICPQEEGVAHRLLVLYPKVGSGHFSIGIPESVSDDAIRDILNEQVPFQTIIDERALKIA